MSVRGVILLGGVLAMCAPAAHAADAERPTVQQAYRHPTNIAISGAIAGIAGAPVAMTGLLLAIGGPQDTPPAQFALGFSLYVAGFTAVGGGGAMMAGGTLAAQQVLVRHGARVTAVPALLSWGTWATSASLILIPRFGRSPYAPWIALSAHVATYALNITQMMINGNAKRAMSEEVLSRPNRVAMTVAPTLGRGQAGLALVATW